MKKRIDCGRIIKTLIMATILGIFTYGAYLLGYQINKWGVSRGWFVDYPDNWNYFSNWILGVGILLTPYLFYLLCSIFYHNGEKKEEGK